MVVDFVFLPKHDQQTGSRYVIVKGNSSVDRAGSTRTLVPAPRFGVKFPSARAMRLCLYPAG